MMSHPNIKFEMFQDVTTYALLPYVSSFGQLNYVVVEAKCDTSFE